MVALPLSSSPYIIDDSPWDATFRMIGIDLHVPGPFGECSKEVSLSSHCPDISVLSHCCGVVGGRPIEVLSFVSELILTIG